MAQSAEEPQAAAPTCSNCGREVAKARRCSVCLKATYCSPECQKEDWRFHKRICKKPDPKDEKPAKAPPPDKEEMDKLMEEYTKDKDPAFAAQMQAMMASMTGAELPKPPEKPPEVLCQNCSKVCDRPMKCGQCKAVSYCSPQCQKSDWRFHKRICAKPPAARAAPGAVGGEAAAAAAAVAAEAPKAQAPPRPKEQNESVVVNNEDVGTWYKHREWKPQEERKQFAPPKLDGAAKAAQAEKELGGSAKQAGSAWNAAGTWEEKDMLPWWQDRIGKLEGWKDEGEVLTIDKVDSVKGEAAIVHVRGQPKFMYDLAFELYFSGLQRCKGCSKSAPGCRCSNCLRIRGKLEGLCWDSDVEPTFKVAALEPDAPSHVKKAGQKEISIVADEILLPKLKSFMDEKIAEYRAHTTSEAPKWASQLPPAAKWESAPASAPEKLG